MCVFLEKEATFSAYSEVKDIVLEQKNKQKDCLVIEALTGQLDFYVDVNFHTIFFSFFTFLLLS